MSLKGVRQLKELIIRYSDYDGSSRGVRDYIKAHLISFAEKNPSITVKTELKRCCHPIVRGHYLNGNSKTICIKNLEVQDIGDYVSHLRNQIGRNVLNPRTSFLLIFIND